MEIWLIENVHDEKKSAVLKVMNTWKRVLLFGYNTGIIERDLYEKSIKPKRKSKLVWPDHLKFDSTNYNYFLSLLFEYIQREKAYKQFKYSTEQKHITQFNNISKFLTTINAENIKSSEIKLRHINQLKNWLLESREQCGVSHASRHAELCKRALDYGVINEYIDSNNLNSLKSERTKTKDVIHLEEHEIEKLQRFVPSMQLSVHVRKLLNQVRDLYVFQCYSGLSYSDLSSYKIVSKNGILWIVNQRLKNDNPYSVPLFPEAKSIYDKYKGNLPLVLNQTYNRKIKEVAQFCAIKKHLTTHTARKTFATLMDQRGVSTKTIADMMGNTITVCQKHYLGKSSKRIEVELMKLGILNQSEIKSENCSPCTTNLFNPLMNAS